MFDNNYNNPYNTETRSLSTKVSAVMKRVYFKMTLGLLVSAFIALWCSESPVYWNFLSGNSWAVWVLLIVEIGLVIAITGAIRAPHSIDPNKCIKCGVCMSNCKFDAITKG